MIRILLLCFMIATLSGCGGCGKSGEEHAGEHPENAEGMETVHLKEESQKMVDLEFVTVKKEPLFASLKVVGEIAQETENVSHVTPSESGLLRSFLKQVGETVEKGTPLCVIQTKTGETMEIASPAHGIVLAQYVKPGEKVDNLTSMMTIADPDLLRVSFNVYEKDIAGIKLGQKVIVESIAYPNQEFKGEIVFVSPSVDVDTRAIKIRVDVKNEEHLLKFGMFVTGKILAPITEKTLVLPDEAIQEVEGKNVVFVPKEGEADEFLLKEIKKGMASEEKTQILMGLEEGQSVVGKGSFYLKSELLKGELEEGHAD